MEYSFETTRGLKYNGLLIEQIQSIAHQMLEREDFIQRELCKGVLLIKFCTDIDCGELEDFELYNKYSQDGTIEFLKDNIPNTYLIDEYVAFEENPMHGIRNDVKVFLEATSKTLDKFEKKMPKKFDVNGSLTKLEEIVNKGKK